MDKHETQGFEAAGKGRRKVDNPYPPSLKHDLWNGGWDKWTHRQVLIVDDDIVLVKLAAEFLEAHDFAVTCEEQGNKALHTYRLAKHDWRFVLSDFHFVAGPTIKTGAMLVHEILKINPEQKLAIYSAAPKDVRRALHQLKTPEVRVLTKPVPLSELLELVERR